MKLRVLLGTAIAAILVTLALPEPSLAQLTRGAISGTVRDESGAPVPGATAVIRNIDTGITRQVITDTQGFYRAPAIDAGRYTVKVELTGFTTVEKTGVDVRSTVEATVNVDLKVAPIGELITVTSEAEAVALNKSNPTIGFTYSGRQAVELPLSAARNVNLLALLTPNTFSAPGSTGISANGSRARNNNFTIDGSDNNDISVTISTSPVIPEGVQEFQNQTNPYNVEFGRNSGAQLNIITKSGTNTFHGEAWDYYRSAGLNALDNIEKKNNLTDPTKLVRHQIGASLGGPLIKDKTHFFALFQRDTQRTGLSLGNSITMPTPQGYQQLQSVPLRSGQSAASRQAVLDRLRFLQDIYATNPTFTNVRTTLVNGVPIQVGTTNVGLFQPVDTLYAMGRLDHQLTQNDHLTLRYIRNNPESTNVVSNCNLGAIFCGNQVVTDHNAALSETHIFSPQLLNEFRVSFIQRDLQFPENDPQSPTAAIGGLFTVGGLANFPQGRVQRSWQFSDVATWARGRHAFKVGADIRYISLDNDAAFNSKGTFNFNSLQDYMNNQAVTFQQALQVSSFVAKQWQTFYFVQDDFRPTSDLVLNLGLRYELSTVPLGFFGASDSQSLNALVPAPVKKDTNNWAPRVGFAWSPRKSGFLGDGKTVFRGGYGITYDVLFYNILTVNASNYPRVVVGRLDNALDVYPNTVPTTGAAVFSPTAGYVNSPQDLQNPMQHIYSFAIGREFGRDFVTEIGYTGSTGRNGINQLQSNPAVLTPAQAALVAATKNTLSIPSVQARRVNPQLGSRTLIASTAKSQYHAGYISINKRMSHGIQFGLAYTLSKLMSDNDESLGVADIVNGSPQIPQDYNRIQDEWSLSAFDRTHRFAANYTLELPGPKTGILGMLLGGWQISGVTQGQSGQPFTVLTGVDSNGNGAGGDRPNVNPNGSFRYVDNHRGFENNGYYVVPLGTNNLPLAFSLGNGNGKRNAHRAAGYWNTDLNLLKRFNLRGSHQLTLRVDALNAFNQDSYGLPVTQMNSTDFGKNIRNWGNRSITLSGKYSF